MDLLSGLSGRIARAVALAGLRVSPGTEANPDAIVEQMMQQTTTAH